MSKVIGMEDGDGRFYRPYEGSAVRALLFPNFPQKQIRLVKEQPKL